LWAIVIVVIYVVYTYVFLDSTSNVLYSGGNARNSTQIAASKIPGNKNSVDFTYSVWIYIKDWQYRYGDQKVIFKRTRTETGGEKKDYVNVSLGGSTNRLDVVIGTGSPGSVDNAMVNSTTMSIENIPIQRWCHIMVSTNNRAIDIYIDGKLVKTGILDRPPFMTNIEKVPIDVCPKKAGSDEAGFEGEISKFRYISRTINPREAYEIYREGPGGNFLAGLINAYKLKLSFLKDNEEVSSFSL
jgi:hypothetical protein